MASRSRASCAIEVRALASPPRFEYHHAVRLFLAIFTSLTVTGLFFGACSEEGACAGDGCGGSGGSSGLGASGGSGGSGGGAESCPGDPQTGDIPCDVFAVLHAKCHACHTDPPANNAPFPLLTYADTQEPYGTKGKLRFQRMREVIEPDAIPHMPFGTAPQLTDAEFETLADWLDDCAPPEAAGQGCACPGTGCD
jgi:hypothetical protein